MKTLIIILMLATTLLAGCQLSHLIIKSPTDPNATMELSGAAADTWIGQLADNASTEASRLEDLFKYNAVLFVGLFLALLAGIVFAVLTKSSWSWVIPVTAGIGLLLLVFVVQAAVYIKWIVLAVVVVAFGVLVFKTWQYKKREIAAKLASALRGPT
jgi:hypothetical protein